VLEMIPTVFDSNSEATEALTDEIHKVGSWDISREMEKGHNAVVLNIIYYKDLNFKYRI
jgi:hypothetical protein